MLKKLGGYHRNDWVDIAGICIAVRLHHALDVGGFGEE